MTLREHRGGESYHKWEGPKTVLGEGLYDMFSPRLSFPPPMFFSDLWHISGFQKSLKLKKRAELKVTDPNAGVSCEALRVSAKICCFLRFPAPPPRRKSFVSGKVKRPANRQFRKSTGVSHGSLRPFSWHQKHCQTSIFGAMIIPEREFLEPH